MTLFSQAGRYFNDLRAQDPSTKLLIVPTGATIKTTGGTNATLFTDATMTTTANNPVDTGVAENSPGISTGGNLLFFAYPGDYDIVMAGRTLRVPVPVQPSDVLNLAAGASSISAVMDNGGTTYTQPTVNFQNLRSGKIVNNTGSSRIDVDLGDAQTLVVSSGTRTINNQATIGSGVVLGNLTFACAANRRYLICGTLFVTTTTTAGVQLLFTFPSGTTPWLLLEGAPTGAASLDVTGHRPIVTANSQQQSFSGAAAGAGSATAVRVHESTFLTTTAGNMTVTFAQASAVATNTTIADGSFLTIVDVT